MSTDLIIGIGIGVAIIAIILTIVCVKNNDEFFVEGFNLFSGGIWGFSILSILGLFIPKINNFVSDLIGGMLSNENIVFPTLSSIVGWLILIVSIIILVAVWSITETYDYSNIKKLLWMLLFGIVYTVGLYLLIGLTIRMVVLAIGLFFVYCVVSSNSESHTYNHQPKNSSPYHTLFDNAGNEYTVSHEGEFGTLYIRDSKGNLINVYDWNSDYFRDDNGKLYRKS